MILHRKLYATRIGSFIPIYLAGNSKFDYDNCKTENNIFPHTSFT